MRAIRLVNGPEGRLCALSCPTHVPIVTPLLAARLMMRQDFPYGIKAVIGAAAGWLLQKVPGVDLSIGATARMYTPEEGKAIAGQVWRVSQTSCPFATADGCLLGGLFTPCAFIADGNAKGPYGWLPTLLFRSYDKEGLRRLVQTHQVPDPMFALLSRREQFPIVHAGEEGPFLATTASHNRAEVSSDVLPAPVQTRSD